MPKIMHMMKNARWDNWSYYLRTAGYFLIFVVGLVGSIQMVFMLLGDWQFFMIEDRTPPTISSTVMTTPSCRFTKVEPDVLVEEAKTDWGEKKTGLKMVKLYVGGDNIGEWPIVGAPKKFELKGAQFVRYTDSRGGDVVTVAEDMRGNASVKKIGDYSPPVCYSKINDTHTGCDCTTFVTGQ